MRGRTRPSTTDARWLAGAAQRVNRFRFEDAGHLEELLRVERDPVRMVCIDGVNSMTGNAPHLLEFARVAREYGALLYVDDAHRFGVIGERSPYEPCPYGVRGNSIVRYFGEFYDNLVLVGGFSKAYSSLLAFIACPTELKKILKVAASPYLYSGPSPVASLATALAGLDVNDARGNECRRALVQRSRCVLDCLDGLGVYTPNHSGFPIIEVPLSDHQRIADVGHLLFERGVYVTLAAYPLVPKADVGFQPPGSSGNESATPPFCRELSGANRGRRRQRLTSRVCLAYRL